MRAQEIYEKLVHARVPEPFKYFDNQNVIKDLVDFRERVEALTEIPGFENDIENFKASILFRTTKDALRIPEPEYESLRALASSFGVKLAGLRAYLEKELENQNPDSVFIKLPSEKALHEVVHFLTRLEKAVGQLITHPVVAGRMEVKNWEKGSLWIEIFVGSQLAVTTIGSAAWAAAVVLKKIQEARLHEQYARGLKLRNDGLEDILNAQRELLSDVTEAEARALAAESYNGDTSPEVLERVKFTIREFTTMLEKGAEIHPALKAPEQVKNLFPALANMSLIESRTKMLTRPSQNETNDS